MTAFEHSCQHCPGARGTISMIYSLLTAGNNSTSLSYTLKWERDLSPIDLADWSKAWSSIAKCSFNTATLEAAYKVLLRWYWVPARIAKSNPSYNDRCFRGCGQRGDELHTWWSCPRLIGFWSRVFGLLSSLFHAPFRKDPKFALLHCPLPGLFSHQQKLATYLFIAAKRTIARAWKKPSVSFAEVKNSLTTLMIHEKMSSILHDSHAKFLKVWAPWWSYTLPNLNPTSLGL